VICVTLVLGLALPQLPAPAAPRTSARSRTAAPDTKEQRAASELKSIQAEIEQITRRVTSEQLERDRLTRELHAAEGAVDRARQALEGVRHERAEGQQRASALAGEQRSRAAGLEHDRELLAQQLRAAYIIGRDEPLKLLLNQQDPARAGRMFAYYSYIGRARAHEIARVEEGVLALAKVRGALATEDVRLASLERQQRERLDTLEQARARRTQVLASLEAESRSSEKQLGRLRGQQAGLEKLLHELRAAVERLDRLPQDTHSAFAELRGKLTWPVNGSQILARFGDSRAGGIKWDGMLLSTEAGAPVHAVYQGRVVYADWLPGLGLLSIVDHGDGYMSLYGHNQQLFKAVGEEVKAGETIAAAGDSGGSNRPELYFEIRRAGKPVDPRPWFRQEHP
jgi:septal ring factor EnvC (AmiA/AmiB activator)